MSSDAKEEKALKKIRKKKVSKPSFEARVRRLKVATSKSNEKPTLDDARAAVEELADEASSPERIIRCLDTISWFSKKSVIATLVDSLSPEQAHQVWQRLICPPHFCVAGTSTESLLAWIRQIETRCSLDDLVTPLFQSRLAGALNDIGQLSDVVEEFAGLENKIETVQLAVIPAAPKFYVSPGQTDGASAQGVGMQVAEDEDLV
eukprot:GHVU01130537.1.p1 GENE.GHVU01130537.1~~GHVU01130537.1.p1  ORF type:complete len:205 (+),score=21.60 GHVU01130537.1:127-741(+)